MSAFLEKDLLVSWLEIVLGGETYCRLWLIRERSDEGLDKVSS